MSVLLDEETVILEGLDFEIPCLAGSHVAQVSIACRFCPDQAFWCLEHWAQKRRRIDDFLAGDIFASVVCASCKAKAYAVEDLVQVVPLGGAS